MNSDPRGRQHEFWIAIGLSSLMSAFSTGFNGLVLGIVFGNMLGAVIGVPFRWWYGLAIGAALGAANGARQAIVKYRRIVGLDQEFAQIGFKPLSDSEAGRITSNLRQMLKGKVELVVPHVRSGDGVHVVVAELNHVTRTAPSADGSSESSTTRQTCVYFEFDGFTFPRFHLRPRGVVNRLLDSVSGGGGIEFEDSILFSSHYALTGAAEDELRQLFSRPVRDCFAEQPGLEVAGVGQHIVVFYPGRLCSSDELQLLLRAAIQCIDQLQTSASSS